MGALKIKLAVAAMAGAALAAPAMAAAPTSAADAVPQTTTASFGDWMVACVEASPAKRCEALHVLKDAKGQAAAVLSIGSPGKGEPLRLSLRVPVNAWVARPVSATIGKNTLSLPFRVCVPQGCIGDLALDAALVGQLAAIAGDAAGTAQWQDATGQSQSLTISTKGLAAALGQLRDKAS